jgi:hypothetical protein
MLYKKALEGNVPFFDWYSWIESTIQKEVFSQLRKFKKANAKLPDALAKEEKMVRRRESKNMTNMKKTANDKKEVLRKSLASFVNKYT